MYIYMITPLYSWIWIIRISINYIKKEKAKCVAVLVSQIGFFMDNIS